MSHEEPRSLLIVEDEWIVAHAVQQSVTRAGYRIAGLASSASEALDLVEAEHPDLMLADIQLDGDMDGIELARLVSVRAGTPVIFLTAYTDDGTLARAEQVMPVGYVVKPFGEAQLLSSVRMALGRGTADDADEARLTRSVRLSRTLANGGPRDPLSASETAPDLSALSAREREVLRLLLTNLRVPGIARSLSISPHTVRNHLKSIFRKLDVGSQAELIARVTG